MFWSIKIKPKDLTFGVRWGANNQFEIHPFPGVVIKHDGFSAWLAREARNYRPIHYPLDGGKIN